MRGGRYGFHATSVPNRRWIFYSNRNDCLRLKKSSRNTNHNCFKVECGYISDYLGKFFCVLKHNWKETEMQNAQVWVWKCERREAGNNDDYDNYVPSQLLQPLILFIPHLLNNMGLCMTSIALVECVPFHFCISRFKWAFFYNIVFEKGQKTCMKKWQSMYLHVFVD